MIFNLCTIRPPITMAFFFEFLSNLKWIWTDAQQGLDNGRNITRLLINKVGFLQEWELYLFPVYIHFWWLVAPPLLLVERLFLIFFDTKMFDFFILLELKQKQKNTCHTSIAADRACFSFLSLFIYFPNVSWQCSEQITFCTKRAADKGNPDGVCLFISLV